MLVDLSLVGKNNKWVNVPIKYGDGGCVRAIYYNDPYSKPSLIDLQFFWKMLFEKTK